MKSNVGGIDKIIRIVAGLVIVVVGYSYQSWWGLVGLIPLFTGIFNFCPVYFPFKFSTRKKKEA